MWDFAVADETSVIKPETKGIASGFATVPESFSNPKAES